MRSTPPHEETEDPVTLLTLRLPDWLARRVITLLPGQKGEVRGEG